MRRVTWIVVVTAVLGCILVSAGACFGNSTATFLASALALTVYYFVFPFAAGPLDPRGTRVRRAFVGLVWSAWLATAIAAVCSAIRGHWL